MKHKLAMLLGMSTMFAGIAAAPAGATPPPFIPPPFPAYCHGYDVSTFGTPAGCTA